MKHAVALWLLLGMTTACGGGKEPAVRCQGDGASRDSEIAPSDLEIWTRHPNYPVFDGNFFAGDAHVWQEPPESYRMVYTDSSVDDRQVIGMATSTDLVNWTPIPDSQYPDGIVLQGPDGRFYQVGVVSDEQGRDNIELGRADHPFGPYTVLADPILTPDGPGEGDSMHDGQVMSRHHLKVVTEAAKRHIGVNLHEPIKNTGLRRTYRNWVAREGARGMEYNAWGNPPNPPEHEANLIFTRMLALYVVIYSSIQIAVDLPENYARYPDPFKFIRDVPAHWWETRVLNGEVGDFASIARRDRGSEDWYLGSLTDEEPRTLRVMLDFLDPGRSYTAQVYRDSDDADWKTRAESIVIASRAAKHDEVLELALAPGGGQAIRFVATPRS